MDNIFRTITTFCTYIEDFFHSLLFEQQRWQNQIFLQICVSLYTYCFVRITLYVAFFNPLSRNTLSSQLMCLCVFFPSSFSVSSVHFLLVIGETVHVVSSTYKPQVCWFFWLTYFGSIIDHIQLITRSSKYYPQESINVDLFPSPRCCVIFPVPYRSNILMFLA